MLSFRISIRARCTTLCDKVCQSLVTGLWFSPSTLVSSTNKTDITEILLKVALNTINNKQTISMLSVVLVEEIRVTLRKTTQPLQVTDKLYHIKLY